MPFPVAKYALSDFVADHDGDTLHQEALQISIEESFDVPLPRLRENYENENLRMKKSGRTTAGQSIVNEKAPIAFETRAASWYLAKAEKVLSNLLAKGDRLQSMMQADEGTHILLNESDVIRADVLYLLSPVDTALRSCLPTNMKLNCRSEVYGHSEDSLGQKQKGKLSTKGASRIDVTWEIETESEVTTFAMLELKRTGILPVKDFAPAVYDPSNETETTSVREKASGCVIDGKQVSSLMGTGAASIAKQATKYHRTRGSAYSDVVICSDWNNMIVFDFMGWKERKTLLIRDGNPVYDSGKKEYVFTFDPYEGHPDKAEPTCTLACERKNYEVSATNKAGELVHFRKLLLGALAHALEQSGLLGDRDKRLAVPGPFAEKQQRNQPADPGSKGPKKGIGKVAERGKKASGKTKQ